MAGLSDGQQALRSGIDQVNGKADQISSGLTSMASDQKALQETTRTNHETVIGRFGDLSKSQADLHTGLNTLNGKADAIASELAAAAQRQTALQQSLAVGNEAAASHATAVAEHQQNLKAAVSDLSIRTHQVSTDLAAMASTQNSFRQMQQNHNEAMTTRTAELADGQRSLRSQMDTLTATTSQTALFHAHAEQWTGDVPADHADRHERPERKSRPDRRTRQRHGRTEYGLEPVADHADRQLAENQQTMKTDINRMAGVVDRAYADLTAVSLAQDTLQTTLASRSDEISGRVARLDRQSEGACGKPEHPDGNRRPDRSRRHGPGQRPRRV